MIVGPKKFLIKDQCILTTIRRTRSCEHFFIITNESVRLNIEYIHDEIVANRENARRGPSSFSTLDLKCRDRIQQSNVNI